MTNKASPKSVCRSPCTRTPETCKLLHPHKGGHQKTGRHHGRTKSGREIFHGPPGSYGLHGHGVIPDNEFEQDWYKKHPDDYKREKAGEYGPHIKEGRKDYHWVGERLVELVHGSKGDSMGMLKMAHEPTCSSY